MDTWTAGDLAEQLRRTIAGLDWGPVSLDAVEAHPPAIRLDFRFRGESVSWDEPWEHLRDLNLEAAAELWMAIVYGHMCEAGYQ